MPAASEAATAMETTTDAVRETATGEMSGTYAAAYVVVQAAHAMAKATNTVPEAAASEMRDTYAVVETHAVMDDCPLDAHAVGEGVAEAAVPAMVQPISTVG